MTSGGFVQYLCGQLLIVELQKKRLDQPVEEIEKQGSMNGKR